MNEECGKCENNRQCFIKKSIGIYECEKINTDEYPIEEQLEEVMKLNQEQVKIIEDLQQRVEQLENIRKEAIEYVKNNCLYEEEYDYDEEDNLIWKGAYDYKAQEDLLNILNKGSDKE